MMDSINAVPGLEDLCALMHTVLPDGHMKSHLLSLVTKEYHDTHVTPLQKVPYMISSIILTV